MDDKEEEGTQFNEIMSYSQDALIDGENFENIPFLFEVDCGHEQLTPPVECEVSNITEDSNNPPQCIESSNKADHTDINQFMFNFVRDNGLEIDENTESTISKIHKDIQGVKGAIVVCMSAIKNMEITLKSIADAFLTPIEVNDGRIYPFPIKTETDLKIFDNKLAENPKLFQEIKFKYACRFITKEDGSKSVGPILSSWVRDDVLNLYSLKGMREKKPFIALENITSLIIQMFDQAVTLKSLEAAPPQKAILSSISDHLKHAGSRWAKKLQLKDKLGSAQ
ncbi:hypothetical protein ACFFRR_006059 [Megaselia abdita]